MSASEFKLVLRLVLANFRLHPGRMLLTSLSTIAAACIVVWVVSGYDALVSQFGGMGDDYLGRYQVLVVPHADDNSASFAATGRHQPPHISPDLIQAIKADSAVAAVEPAFETRVRIRKVEAKNLERPQAQGNLAGPRPLAESAGPRIAGGMEQVRQANRSPVLVGTNAPSPAHELVAGRWIDASHPERLEGVLTVDAAQALNLKLGDRVMAGSGKEPTQLTVIGVVRQPKQLPPPTFMVGLPPTRNAALRGGPAGASLFVPVELANVIARALPPASYVGVVLKDSDGANAFAASWSRRLASATPPAESRTIESVESEVETSTTFEGVRAQAYSATGMSLLAALFIIFTTLSMGVHERIRQFAVLRAVALTKRQVGAMIAVEGVILGVIGWAGGMLAGWGLIALIAYLRPLAGEPAAIGPWCVALSGMCALGGSLAASLPPAWRATRVSPLDAMAPQQRFNPMRISWLATIVALAMISTNPLLVFYVPMQDKARYAMSAAVGCTCMAIGFVLLTPLTILLTEKLLAPLLARLLRIDPRLLATQLTANAWRTAGTSVAMTLGLGLYVAMQTWGYSMLGPFTPGKWSPDVLINIAPSGMADADVFAVQKVQGLVAVQCLPLAVKQVKFTEDITGAHIGASATRQDSCVFVGVDPEAALGGLRPMFDFDFVQGTRDDAIAKFKQGRCCLVSDHFTRDTGLAVGQTFSVTLPDDNQTLLEYEIAGVVSMPGWHWMSKVGFRRGRAAGLMFADYDQVRRDFHTGRTTLLWSNMDGSASESQIQAALQPIAQRNFDAQFPQSLPRQAIENAAPSDVSEQAERGSVKANVVLRSVESVRKQIRQRADGIIWALSQLPLITLLVTSLGVVNTVLASVRARRWDLGVLRALGVTRLALIRLILSEALLVGLVACLLSLGFGVLAGYCGTGVTRYMNVRGGQITPLIVPWPQICLGFAITLGLCLTAAMWPAISTGRAEPLRLLQGGRSSG